MARRNTTTDTQTPVQPEVVVSEQKVSKVIKFHLRQPNGNNVSFEMSDLSGYNNDTFAGTILFPALLRLTKGAAKLFDRKLPVSLMFSIEVEGQDTSAKVIANINMASSSLGAVRKACLIFNEAIAGLVTPAEQVSIYALRNMRGDKGAALKAHSAALLSPSISLVKALPELSLS